MVLVHSEHPQVFKRRLHIHFRFCFCVFSHLEIVQGNGSLVDTAISLAQVVSGPTLRPPPLSGNPKMLPKYRDFELAAGLGPFCTVSPSLALISTTRPVASEITGTVLLTSGVTTPVTFNVGAAKYSVAFTRGNCSGCSTVKRPTSSAFSTLGAGGAPLSPTPLSRRIRQPRCTRANPKCQPICFPASLNHLASHCHI